MAVNKKGAKRPSKARKAPGNKDTKFFDRLSDAVGEEFRKVSAAISSNDAGPQRRAGAALPPPSRDEDETAPKSPRPKTKAGAAAKAGKRGSGADHRAVLRKELTSLLDELDEEGLDFLLEQARVHRYNMEVERLNAVADRAEQAAAAAAGRRGAAKKAEPDLAIARAKDGSTYNLVAGGRYKTFAPDEMLALVRIAHLNDDDDEAIRALIAWLKRERGDVLNDLEIGRPSDPLIHALLRVLRSSFAPPKPR